MNNKGSSKFAFAVSIVIAAVVTAVAATFVLKDEQKVALQYQARLLKQKVSELVVSSGFSTCRIKGNISFNSGERIYHMPGQEDYYRTKINWSDGERWFCTEEEAIAAGWRKAGN